ncbi:MAG: head GIN domain-containing protein [Saprospiraceae bacterium]
MKAMTLLAGTLLFLSPLYAQDVRKLQPFDEIMVSGNITVLLQKGEEESAVVEANGISEDKISVYVKNGKLKLQLLDGFFYKNATVNIVVTYRSLRLVNGSAGSRIKSDAVIEADLFSVKAGSGAQVELEIKVNSLSAVASEGAELELSGTTASQNASAATGGQYHALNLQCDQTEVRASTGGKAVVVALKSLDASVNTGGEVEYSGDPEVRNTRNMLAGEIRQI